jgi:hypothetical protein
MQGAAAGWPMTGLDPAPVSESLGKVAASLPIFMFALPAGALADVVDRRWLLIVMQVAVSVLCPKATLICAGSAIRSSSLTSVFNRCAIRNRQDFKE